MEKVFVKHYWLKEEIGRSSHSIVYQAADSETEQEAALKKLIIPALLLNVQKEDAVNNFLQEIECRGRFTHPFILELHDCFEHEDSIYLVEEFVDGKSLAFYEGDGRYYTDLYAGLYIYQMAAEALFHAHSHDYVHRNMKPENFILNRDNALKITDFMVCSFLFREQKVRTTLDVDLYENLTIYAAPESVRGNLVNHSSNIFSLAVMMYEFFTGTHPFKGRTPEETFENIQKKTPLQASHLNPALPEVVNYIIDKSLKKDPAERYGNFKELLADFEYYYEQPGHEPVRLYLAPSRSQRNSILSAKEVTRKTIFTYSRKLLAFSSLMAKKIKKSPGQGLFIEDALDPAKIKKKKKIREELQAGGAEAPGAGEELQAGGAEAPGAGEELQAGGAEDPVTGEELPAGGEEEPAVEKAGDAASVEEIFTISPPPLLNLETHFFSRRGTFFQENRRLILIVAAVLVIIGGSLLFSFLSAPEAPDATPVSSPASVILNKGTSNLMVKCSIGEAEIKVVKKKEEFPPIVDRLDIHGEWEVNGISSGDYSVVIRRSGYSPFYTTITLEDDDTYFLTADLGIMIPTLDVKTEPPGALIKLDARTLGASPLKAYDAKPGEYILTAEMPGYDTYKEKVALYKNETLMRKITLDKSGDGVSSRSDEAPDKPPSSPTPSSLAARIPPATIVIDSIPAVASVYLDDREIGTTPVEYVISPFQESVELKAKKKSFYEWNKIIHLKPGERKEVLADLVKVTSGSSPPVRGPGTISTPSARDVMTINYNVRYSRGSAFDKLDRKRLIIDFKRDEIDYYIKKFINSQLELAGGRGGSFQLDIIFAVQVERGAELSKPKTSLVGSFRLENKRTGRVLLEDSELREFSYSGGSVEVTDRSNNYNQYEMVYKSAPTEEALSMFSRFASKIEQSIKRAQ